ncbi:MAG: phage terminase large subunit [Methermicoccaceae archaeon]
MTYIPNLKQIEAHCAEEQFVGYGGAMGGGKTRWLCESALSLSIQYPGNFGIVARQSGPALRLTTMEVFFNETLRPGSREWKQLGAKFNKAEGVLLLGALDPVSKIWFTGLDSDNVERVKSLNLGFFAIDEATEVSESIFLMLITRLRRKGVPRIARKGLISANPEAGWVKRRFVDQQLANYRFIQANYKDNPHLPEDYHELFDSMPLTWREKYLEGNWGAVSGLIYRDFEPQRHIIPVSEIPPDWWTIRGLDHGQQNPTACLSFMIGYKDAVYLPQLLGEERVEMMNSLYDEYPILVVDKLYYNSGLVSEHKRGIRKLWPEFAGSTYGDPSMWRRDREKLVSDGKSVEYSIADEYLSPPDSLHGLVKGNSIVNVGINRVSQLLRIGHLYFMDHPSLEPLIGDGGEIRGYSWKQPRTDADDWPEVPLKQRDHACDALRYGVMSLPPPKTPDPKVVPYNSFMAARARALAEKKGKSGVTIHGGKVIGL